MYTVGNLNTIYENVNFDNESIIVHTRTNGKRNEAIVFAKINKLKYTPGIDLCADFKIKCGDCGTLLNSKDLKPDHYYQYIHCSTCCLPTFLYMDNGRYRFDNYDTPTCGLTNSRINCNILVLHKMNNIEKRKIKQYHMNKIQRSLKYWDKTIKKELEYVKYKIIENHKMSSISHYYEYDF